MAATLSAQKCSSKVWNASVRGRSDSDRHGSHSRGRTTEVVAIVVAEGTGY